MKCPRVVSFAVAGLLSFAAAGRAATINVGGTATDLVDAINAANSNGEDDTLVLTSTTYLLTGVESPVYGPSGLPSITSKIVVEGNGAVITRSGGTFRFFHVAAAGDLTLRALTLDNGYVKGGNGGAGGGGGGAGAGMGGAIFSQGALALDGCTLSDNAALGGTGGAGGGNGAGGGGGGMGGNGGNRYSWAGGGGGGFTGDGGAGNSGAGGYYGGGGGGGYGDTGNPKTGGAGDNTGGNGGNANGTTGLDGVAGGLGGGGGAGGYWEDTVTWESYGGGGGAGGIGGGGGGGVYAGDVGGIGGWGGGAGSSGQYTNGRAGGFGGGGSAAGYGYTTERPGGAGGWGGGTGGESEDTCGGGGGGAGLGGAVFIEAGTVSITNCTFSGNSATGGAGANGDTGSGDTGGGGDGGDGCGGAVFVYAGTVSILNSTAAGNTIGGGAGGAAGTSTNGGNPGNPGAAGTTLGGGLCVYGGVVTVTNTILADTTGGDDCHQAGGALTSGGYNLVETPGTYTAAGTDITGADPVLDVLADNGGPTFTCALLGGSQAIDPASSNGAPSVDQRGYGRSGNADIGAYEYNGVPLPEMAVEGNLTEIADGDATPSAADWTDFGTVDIAAGVVTRTFTIRNTGQATLNLPLTPRVTLTGSADFALTSDAPATVAAGGTATFEVTFDPSSAGVKTASISIANDDPDENPYSFAIQGTGANAPEIAVEGNSTLIADGDTTPSVADWTDFGDAEINFGSAVRVFTINNLGGGTLNLPDTPRVTVSPGAFSLTADSPTFVASLSSATFEVTFDPTVAGPATGSISITNDDADENPYNFSIQGNGTTAPEITVIGNLVQIADGDSTPSVADNTDFGDADILTGSVLKYFTIANDGSAPLNLSASPPRVVVTGAAFTFSTAEPPAAIGVAGSTSIGVTFDPTAVGIATGTVSIASDDADENPYDFAIQGTGTATPDIAVEGMSVAIADGDATPSTSDGTDFGSLDITSGIDTHTFTIVNTGSAVLNLTDTPRVTVTGADFSLATDAPATVGVGGSVTFEVTFDPAALGLSTGTVSIASDDPDESPYDFSIQGTGVSVPEMAVEGNSVEIADGDATPTAADHTGFGSANVTGGTVTRTFTIRNLGSATLNLTDTPRVTVTGADFTLATDAPVSIASLGSATFEVTFDPSATGASAGSISIANDDPDENPYDFLVEGNGVVPSDDSGCAGGGGRGGAAGAWPLFVFLLAAVALGRRTSGERSPTGARASRR